MEIVLKTIITIKIIIKKFTVNSHVSPGIDMDILRASLMGMSGVVLGWQYSDLI